MEALEDIFNRIKVTTNQLNNYKTQLDITQNLPKFSTTTYTTTTAKPVFSYFNNFGLPGEEEKFEINKNLLDEILTENHEKELARRNGFLGYPPVQVGTSFTVSNMATKPKQDSETPQTTTKTPAIKEEIIQPRVPVFIKRLTDSVTTTVKTTTTPTTTTTRTTTTTTMQTTTEQVPDKTTTFSFDNYDFDTTTETPQDISALVEQLQFEDQQQVNDYYPSNNVQTSPTPPPNPTSTLMTLISHLTGDEGEKTAAASGGGGDNFNSFTQQHSSNNNNNSSIFRLWESYALPQFSAKPTTSTNNFADSYSSNFPDLQETNDNINNLEDFSWNEDNISPLDPILKGNWLEWLASKSKLKQPKRSNYQSDASYYNDVQDYNNKVNAQPTRAPNILDDSKWDSSGLSKDKYIVQTSFIVTDKPQIDEVIKALIETNPSPPRVPQYKFDDDRKPFLLSDENTRDILYYDIIENEGVAESNRVEVVFHKSESDITQTTTDKATTEDFIQFIDDNEVTATTEATDGDEESYQEVVNQNNKLVDILKSTLEMQAYLLDKVVAFFVN